MKTYIGIDNGVSGSVGKISDDPAFSFFVKTPTRKEQNYTKKKDNITRLDIIAFKFLLESTEEYAKPRIAILERPFVNPMMFKASLSAIRCMEAQITVLESLKIPYLYIDSKQWQKELLPQGIKGRKELKKASMDIGLRLFPQYEEIIKKQKDADGILIAEFARRNNL